MNLFLIGYRGTGKSTVGRLAAARLKAPFADADEEIERRAGRSIAAIFADSGEAGFRDLESDVLAELSSRSGHVLALGGGAVLREQNRALLKTAGKTAWLRATEAAIIERISRDAANARRRPNLTAAGGAKEIRSLLALRTPIYRSCADREFSTENATAAEVADEIVQWFRSLQVGAARDRRD